MSPAIEPGPDPGPFSRRGGACVDTRTRAGDGQSGGANHVALGKAECCGGPSPRLVARPGDPHARRPVYDSFAVNVDACPTGHRTSLAETEPGPFSRTAPLQPGAGACRVSRALCPGAARLTPAGARQCSEKGPGSIYSGKSPCPQRPRMPFHSARVAAIDRGSFSALLRAGETPPAEHCPGPPGEPGRTPFRYRLRRR